MESFFPRILNASRNNGISNITFVSQMGNPVIVFIMMDKPVSPPGAIL